MDFGFIREVMSEQVRLNVALCEAQYENATLLREKEEAVALARREMDDALHKCEEWKQKYEKLHESHIENEKLLRIELKKIREEVGQTGAIPYDIMNNASEASDENDESEEVVEKEEKNIVIEDKSEKRREYMKEYMKKKRESKKGN